MLKLLSQNKDVIYSLLNQGCRLLLAIVLLPFALASLSNYELTVWFLLTTIVAFGQSVIVGFASTFVRFIAYSASGVLFENYSNRLFSANIQKCPETNQIEKGKLLYIQQIMYLILSVIFFLSLGAIGYFSLRSPIEALEDQQYAWQVSFFLLLTSSIALYLSMFQVILEGNNEVKTVQKIGALWHVFGVCGTLLLLSYKSTLFTLILSYQFILLGNLLTLYFYCRNTWGGKSNRFGKPVKNFDVDMIKHIFESAWKIGFTSIFASGTKHISAVIVSQLFVGQTAASFLLTKRLFEILETFSQVTFRAKLPILLGLYGGGKLPEYILSLRAIVRLSYAIYVIGFTVILFAGEFLLSLIDQDGTKTLGDQALIIAFGFAGLISRWGAINLSIANHANRIIDHMAVLISSVVFGCFVFFSFSVLGILSFPLATILGSLATSFLIITYVYPLLAVKFLKFEVSLSGPFLLYCCILVIITKFIH